MELKTFQAPSMSDALAKVKADLGNGAVILHTRTLKRGGFLGVGVKSLVEITATADPRLAELRRPKRRRAAPPPKAAGYPTPPGLRPPGPSPADRTPTASRETPAPLPRIDPPARSPDADPVLRSEVREIRAMVEDLLRHTGRNDGPQLPADLLDLYTRLIGQDVADEFARQLIDRVRRKIENHGAPHWDPHGRLVGGHSQARDDIRHELQQAIIESLPPAEPLVLTADKRPTVIALVGPTGVGKTTTIAKLAANVKLKEGKAVGLITIDTFRIAAVEQLKTYAEILQVPLSAVTTPEEMAPALEGMGNLDLILIDTVGRSQNDEMRIAELGRFLQAARPDQVHLVLSTTGREETLRQAVRNFSVLGPKHVIFTKLDEAVGFGVILNVLRSLDLSLSYLTTGQSVPNDIEIGSPRRIAELVLDARPPVLATASQPVPAGEGVD